MSLLSLDSSVVASPLFESGASDCDVGVFSDAAVVVASGVVTGPKLATLLERLAIRLEAAAEVAGSADVVLMEAAYNSIVASLETRLGFPGTSLRQDVAELKLIHRLFGRNARVPYAAALAGSDSLTAVSVAGGAVAVLKVGLSCGSAPKPEQVVLTDAVYRALLSIGIVLGDSPHFFVQRDRSGFFSFCHSREVTPRAIEALPEGQYLVPGAQGAYVARHVIVAMLQAVWVSPRRGEQRGYCYLRVVPPLQRDHVAQVLGEFPTVGQLVDVCPAVYTWCNTEAKYYAVTDGGSGDLHYHISSYGSLSFDLVPEVRLGAGHDTPAHMAQVFDDFERRFATSDIPRDGRGFISPSGSFSSRGQSVGPSSPPGLAAPTPVRGHSRNVSVASSQRNRGELARVATPVFSVQPGFLKGVGATWVEPECPLAKEWSDRLASGPPVGHHALKELSKSKPDNLPPIVVAEGGRLAAVTGATVTGQRRAPWVSHKCPLPGWNFERCGSVRGDSLDAVPPSPGVMCRYEVRCEGNFIVNGMTFSGYRSAFWVDGSVVFSQLGRDTAIWRMWHDAGCAALGVDFMSLHVGYLLPAIVPAVKARTDILQMAYVGSDDGRGEALYRATMPGLSGSGSAQLYVADALVSEAIVLSVMSSGLAYITLHGVTLPAVGGAVSCVTDLLGLRLGYHVASYRSRDPTSAITVEVRRTRGKGASKPKVQSANKLLPAPGSESMF